jgi:hypothetical protein
MVATTDVIVVATLGNPPQLLQHFAEGASKVSIMSSGSEDKTQNLPFKTRHSPSVPRNTPSTIRTIQND